MKFATITAFVLVAASGMAMASEPDSKDAGISDGKIRPGTLHPDASSDMLSDDFMRDVSDGVSPAKDGVAEEEESGETLDQTLRAHTKGFLSQ